MNLLRVVYPIDFFRVQSGSVYFYMHEQEMGVPVTLLLILCYFIYCKDDFSCVSIKLKTG